MSLLAGQILNGIATGMLYALMGLGLSLITGVLNIPNFAHGALFAVGEVGDVEDPGDERQAEPHQGKIGRAHV